MLKDKNNETMFIYQSKRVCGPSESSFNLSSEIDLPLRLNSLKVVFYFYSMELTFIILCVSQGTSSTRDEKNIGVAIIPVI